MVLAGLAVLAYATDGPNDVDRAAYVRQNLRLFSSVPTFPGATRVALKSERWRVQREPFGGSYVAGYGTIATYQVPPDTTASGIARFYRLTLRGWRCSSWGKIPEGWPRVASARGRRAIENTCYARRDASVADASVCVDLMGFLVRGHIVRGGCFSIEVDYRAFVPRSN